MKKKTPGAAGAVVPTKTGGSVAVPTPAPYEYRLPQPADAQMEAQIRAAIAIAPHCRHAFLQKSVSGQMVGDNSTTIIDGVDVLEGIDAKIRAGDSSALLSLLTSQALTLDITSTDLFRRAGLTDDLEHYEKYLRLGIKAQAASRATVEALAKIMRGGEQVVKHVHVYEGGQAVVAGTFNHGGSNATAGGESRKSEGQSDAAEPA